jgi:hypothetical protein
MQGPPKCRWEPAALNYILVVAALAGSGAYFLYWLLEPTVRPNVGLAAYEPPAATRLLPVLPHEWHAPAAVAQREPEVEAAPAPEPEPPPVDKPAKKARVAQHHTRKHHARKVVRRPEPPQRELAQGWAGYRPQGWGGYGPWF